MRNDQLDALEAILDDLERRNLTVTRLKVGDIELDFGPSAPARVLDIAPRAMPEPLTAPKVSYESGSLFPNGRPSFVKPPGVDQ